MDLTIVRRPKTTPIHELERYLRCKDCSTVRRYAYKRSHLVALRPNEDLALDPPRRPGGRGAVIPVPAILLTGVQHRGSIFQLSE